MEDQLLVVRCRRGSVEAMARIYRKYRKDLLVLAMALLNDKAAAEDIVHDVFLAFAAGEGYRTGLFLYGPDAFPNEFRYARRLFSFQGPAQRSASILPIHLRHLKGW